MCVCVCVCVCVCPTPAYVYIYGPVGWGYRIHRQLSVEGQDSPNECPVYDTKQSDGEAPVMQELWGMRSTPLLPSVPGLLYPWVVASNRVLYMVQIELNCVLMLNWIA